MSIPTEHARPGTANFRDSRTDLIRTYLCYVFIVISSESLLAVLTSVFLHAIIKENIPSDFLFLYYFQSAIALVTLILAIFTARKQIRFLVFVGLYIGITFVIFVYSTTFSFFYNILVSRFIPADQAINWLLYFSFVANSIYIPLIGYGLYQIWRAPSAKELANLKTSSAQ